MYLAVFHLLQTTIGKFHELFASYSQQDSQELLLFIMDGLHEDLNRVILLIICHWFVSASTGWEEIFNIKLVGWGFF